MASKLYDSYDAAGIDLPSYARGGNVKTYCPECAPLHRTIDKCLSVNLDEQVWNCHRCGFSGALRKAPGTFRMQRPTRVYAKPIAALQTNLSRKAEQFFTDRGISIDVVRKHGITGDDRAIKFPYYRDGELVNIKTRYAGKKFSMEADCELIFYGLDDCAGAEQLVIVEGELDKLACECAGLPHVLSVPNGAQPNGRLDYFQSGESLFDRCHTVVIAGDADAPGQALTEELARRIGREKCYRVTWPAGCKDANDVLMQHGDFALMAAVSTAEPFPLEGIQTAKDVMIDALMLYDEGRKPGVDTGWRAFTGLYTVKTGQMTVVTGVPGSGKSEFLDALMMNLVMRENWTFAVFSPENSPPAHHFSKLAEKYHQKPFAEGPTPRMGRDEFIAFLTWAQDRIQLINLEEPNLGAILDLAQQLVRRLGIKGLILDPWNEIEHSRPDKLTETEYVSICLGQIRRFARNHDLHVFVVAHPKKMYRENGEVPIPTPYDISGSANWFNKADNCLTVSRDKNDDTSPVQIHVQKVRFKEIGHLGIAELHYDRPTGCFRDINPYTGR